MGVGMVLYDDMGNFITARTLVFSGRLDVDTGEAMSFLEAISWVKYLQLQKIVIKGNSKVVVDALNSPHIDVSIFDDFIQVGRNILNSNQLFSVRFVKRNAIAHAFARMFRSFESSCCWVDPPEFVIGLPLAPCTCC
ncbi:hypothetical protein ACS0TY_004448 [Phlomoides rotata]